MYRNELMNTRNKPNSVNSVLRFVLISESIVDEYKTRLHSSND